MCNCPVLNPALTMIILELITISFNWSLAVGFFHICLLISCSRNNNKRKKKKEEKKKKKRKKKRKKKLSQVSHSLMKIDPIPTAHEVSTLPLYHVSSTSAPICSGSKRLPDNKLSASRLIDRYFIGNRDFQTVFRFKGYQFYIYDAREVSIIATTIPLEKFN